MRSHKSGEIHFSAHITGLFRYSVDQSDRCRQIARICYIDRDIDSLANLCMFLFDRLYNIHECPVHINCRTVAVRFILLAISVP